MKRIWIFSIVLLTIISFTFASVKVNALTLNTEYKCEDEDSSFSLVLLDETNYKLIGIQAGTNTNVEVNGTYEFYDEELNVIVLYMAGEVFDYFTLNDETLTFDFYEIEETPVIPDEPIIEEPSILETKAKEFTDWIIALVVSFLGSSAFYLIVKAILKKTINTLKDKVTALTENKNISEESKKAYENKINELENTINKLIENNDKLLNYVREKLEVDAEKEKKMAELLDTLLVEEGVKND